MKKRKRFTSTELSIIQCYKTSARALDDYDNKLRGQLKLGTLSRMAFIESIKTMLIDSLRHTDVVSVTPNDKRSKTTIKVNGKPTMFKVHRDELIGLECPITRKGERGIMKNKYRVVVLATDEVTGTYDKLDAALNQKVISEHLLDTECCVMDETAAFEMYEEGLLTMQQYEDLLRFNEED